MARKPAPERLAAFKALEDDTLYTASQIATMANFEGAPEEIKRRRRNFRATLSYHYRPPSEPDDFIKIEGQGTLQPAWFGRVWKKAAGLND